MSLLGTEAVEAVARTIDELFTSDDERAHARAVAEKLRQQPQKLQIELNKIEARHSSVFVAGWRPFIGWLCGAGLAFLFLVNPIIQWVTGQPGPQVPSWMMLQLVATLLGFGTLRTVEKKMGLAR